MTEMIQQRQQEKHSEQRHDLFSSLLNTNDEDSGETKLTVSELIGRPYFIEKPATSSNTGP
jgi:cytochrome P450